MAKGRVSPIEWLTSEESTSVGAKGTRGTLESSLLNDTREDGELSDEGSDIEDVDYNILPRPTVPPTQVPDPTTSALPDQSVTNNNNNNNNAIGVDEIFSDEEEIRSASSSSDSDSEDEPSFKRRNSIPSSTNFGALSAFRNPNAADYMQGASMETPSEAKTLCEEKMLSFQQQRKVNNIWAEVLQEEQQQQALEKLGSIDVDTSKILVERGPESYAFKPGNANPALKRKRNVGGAQKRDKKRPNPDDSDVSSTGLSDDDMDHLKKETSSGKKNQLASGFKKTANMPIPQVRKFLHSIKGRQLSYFMANELEERKKQLVVRAVELLGKPYCIRMFIKTLKIEKKGGLLIKNQSRRRTPGGVFFYMLRKDPKYPPEVVDQVFAIDREITAKEKKAAKAARRHQRKAKLEKRLAMEKLKEQQQQQQQQQNVQMATEEGEVHSSGESLPSYESDSSESDQCMEGAANAADFDDEVSNDYLDIHCDGHEFDDV